MLEYFVEIRLKSLSFLLLQIKVSYFIAKKIRLRIYSVFPHCSGQ